MEPSFLSHAKTVMCKVVAKGLPLVIVINKVNCLILELKSSSDNVY